MHFAKSSRTFGSLCQCLLIVTGSFCLLLESLCLVDSTEQPLHAQPAAATFMTRAHACTAMHSDDAEQQTHIMQAGRMVAKKYCSQVWLNVSEEVLS